MIIEVPTKVTVHTHCCPKCGNVYWDDSKDHRTIFLGSPFITCTVCQTNFVDKQLIKEWATMTKKEKIQYLHFKGNPTFKLLFVFGWICIVVELLLLSIFIRNLVVGDDLWISNLVIMALLSPVIVYFLVKCPKNYTFYQNRLKDPRVVESIKRTKDPEYQERLKAANIPFDNNAI
jgi:hypothetical protein